MGPWTHAVPNFSGQVFFRCLISGIPAKKQLQVITPVSGGSLGSKAIIPLFLSNSWKGKCIPQTPHCTAEASTNWWPLFYLILGCSMGPSVGRKEIAERDLESGIGGTDQGSNPALLLTNCVAWGELCNLSNLACYLWNGSSITAKSLQSCPTLCDPIDGSPPGSFVHGIFQARVLEWGAIAFSSSIIGSW